MTVNTTQVAVGGSYLAISSENATLITALSEVANELEAQGASQSQTQIVSTFDATNNKFSVVAIIKRH